MYIYQYFTKQMYLLYKMCEARFTCLFEVACQFFSLLIEEATHSLVLVRMFLPDIFLDLILFSNNLIWSSVFRLGNLIYCFQAIFGMKKFNFLYLKSACNITFLIVLRIVPLQWKYFQIELSGVTSMMLLVNSALRCLTFKVWCLVHLTHLGSLLQYLCVCPRA